LHADAATVRARQVIVAIPPHLAGRIIYEPGLPAARDQLTQRVPRLADQDDRRLRHAVLAGAGLNGQVTSDQGPVKIMFDASPASGTRGCCWASSTATTRALDDQSDQQRASAALQSYVRYFGKPAGAPRMYFDQVWEREIYTGGCPAGVMPTGVLTEYGSALRAPAGRIHWAGTETATVWTGYMDGAVQSGRPAAAEALASV